VTLGHEHVALDRDLALFIMPSGPAIPQCDLERMTIGDLAACLRCPMPSKSTAIGPPTTSGPPSARNDARTRTNRRRLSHVARGSAPRRLRFSSFNHQSQIAKRQRITNHDSKIANVYVPGSLNDIDFSLRCENWRAAVQGRRDARPTPRRSVLDSMSGIAASSPWLNAGACGDRQ
jgi:hypothetical protein